MGLFDRFRSNDDETRVPRKDRHGARPLTVGAVVLVAVLIISYLGFTKNIPFHHGFQVKAVFQTANSLRANSPVRIAGVNVGKVKQIERYDGSDASVVTMEITKAGLPIHKDATFKVRPRIFLEGNFFVDLHPGTPEAPTISSGDTIGITQTAAPVQFGDLLTSLQYDDRRNLQDTINGFGGALTRKPDARDDAAADPSVRGKTAAQSLNLAAKYAAPAFKGSAIVNDAFLGTEPHDVSRLLKGLSQVTEGLGRDEGTLQDFVTNFNATTRIFASESTSLRATIRGLAPTLTTADRTLADLNSAFPPTRQFAKDFLPAVKETPSTIDAAMPFIAQTRKLLGPDELRGLAEELSPATRDLATAINGTETLLPQQDLASKCLDRVILPVGDIKVQDGSLSTGAENYKEFWYSMVGIAGEGQNFDGNGMYVRFQPGGGTQTVSVGPGSLSGDTFFARQPNKPIGTRPVYTGKRPPYKPNVACYTQQLPDVNGAATGAPDKTVATSSGASSPGLTTAPQLPVSVPAPPPVGAPRSSSSTSVTGALLDRLNPFRGGGK
jgi:phospholipid/cholesterol/gamma-HCH transport system substrate-binding protein